MKKTLCLTHKPEAAVGLHIPFSPDCYPLLGEEVYDEIYIDYAHLFELPNIFFDLSNSLADGGVIDITVPLAGCPASFENPFTRSFWTPQTFLYFQAGPHSLHPEYDLGKFSIDIGVTKPDSMGNQFIRARMTKVGEPHD